MPTIEQVFTRLKERTTQRFLAFGSSNTERRLAGMHWFDCFELAVKNAFGRVHRCINTGIGGDTSQQLLDRFDEDAALYRPHAVFITVGGNDATPAKGISLEMFRENLFVLHQRFDALDCAVVFQTYYAPDASSSDDPAYLARFYRNMQVVRDVAAETGAHLIDHMARWEPFRLRHPDHYSRLMADVMHVNARGNLLMGLEIARHFNLPLGEDDSSIWAFARQCQNLMNAAATP